MNPSDLPQIHEVAITQAILNAYHRKLHDAIESDVAIIGAGPSGLLAGGLLARAGMKVTIVEKRLAPGGGIWGGAIGMNEVVVQQAACPILEQLRVRTQRAESGLYTLDAAELACALGVHALQGGATLLNLMCVEDVCVQEGRLTGLVVNRTMLGESLPIDPICLKAKAVIDSSGHDAVTLEMLRRRGLLKSHEQPMACEGPMHAAAGEAFVVDRVAEIFPGLWVCGMAVCAAFGGPRMGPIFGGMLLSGQRVAQLLLRELK
jgi:thiamine thiazole synthase